MKRFDIKPVWVTGLGADIADRDPAAAFVSGASLRFRQLHALANHGAHPTTRATTPSM